MISKAHPLSIYLYRVRKLIWACALFLLSLLFGALGYIFIEDYQPLDALYMAVITFSTVGYTEVNSLSTDGKIFTIVFITLNLGIFAYTVSVLSRYLFEGELRKIFRNIISSRDLSKMDKHVIVCGFGKNGSQACEELAKDNVRFVIIEGDEDVINAVPTDKGYHFVMGNATADEVLKEANIDKAMTIITTLPEDADNVFIALTAKELNPSIKVIAKATEATSERKLYRAGASHVVMPDRLGGMHMANLITKPYVIEFLDSISGIGRDKLVLEEVAYVDLKNQYQGKSLRELDIRNLSGATVIAVKGDKAGFEFNPHSNKMISEGDVLIVLGKQENIDRFDEEFKN